MPLYNSNGQTVTNEKILSREHECDGEVAIPEETVAEQTRLREKSLMQSKDNEKA
jgi:hypothetical protein